MFVFYGMKFIVEECYSMLIKMYEIINLLLFLMINRNNNCK